ncbi:MAG: hypothetical protein AB7P17_07415 [Nitrospirales bacterium]
MNNQPTPNHRQSTQGPRHAERAPGQQISSVLTPDDLLQTVVGSMNYNSAIHRTLQSE